MKKIIYVSVFILLVLVLPMIIGVKYCGLEGISDVHIGALVWAVAKLLIAIAKNKALPGTDDIIFPVLKFFWGLFQHWIMKWKIKIWLSRCYRPLEKLSHVATPYLMQAGKWYWQHDERILFVSSTPHQLPDAQMGALPKEMFDSKKCGGEPRYGQMERCDKNNRKDINHDHFWAMTKKFVVGYYLNLWQEREELRKELKKQVKWLISKPFTLITLMYLGVKIFLVEKMLRVKIIARLVERCGIMQMHQEPDWLHDNNLMGSIAYTTLDKLKPDNMLLVQPTMNKINCEQKIFAQELKILKPHVVIMHADMEAAKSLLTSIYKDKQQIVDVSDIDIAKRYCIYKISGIRFVIPVDAAAELEDNDALHERVRKIMKLTKKHGLSGILSRISLAGLKNIWNDYKNHLQTIGKELVKLFIALWTGMGTLMLGSYGCISSYFANLASGNLFEVAWKGMLKYLCLLFSLIPTCNPTCEQQHTPAIMPKDTIVAVVAPYNVSDTTVLCYFAYDSYSLPDSSENLKNLVHTLKQYPSRRITIAAYTDNKGSRRYNERLSQRRAKAVYDYLCSKGIDGDRIIWQGKGVSLKYNTDAQNRRAEFVYRNEICSQ